MEKLTRRGLLKQAPVGMAAIGIVPSILTATPHLAAASATADTQPTDTQRKEELSTPTLSRPLVAHVRNLATGEVSVLAGERESIVHDHTLVAHLLKAAK